MKKHTNLILTDGGLGDLVCELVAVDYNIRTFPNVKFHLWVPDYLLFFAKHVLPRGSDVKPFSKAKKEFRHNIPGFTTEWCTNHTAMRTHPVDYGFHMLCDRHEYDLNKKNYLQIKPEKVRLHEFTLPEKYICLIVTAAEPVKAMPAETARQLIHYIMNRGYGVVFLGREQNDTGFRDVKTKAKPIEVDYSLGVNLLNKTNVLQAGAIMANAKAVVGMDGGMIHVAGCTQTNIVAGYTLADPKHLAPIRNGSQSWKFFPVEPDTSVTNRYYQTYNNFVTADYRTFPGWEDVVRDMTADKFISQLDKVLGGVYE